MKEKPTESEREFTRALFWNWIEWALDEGDLYNTSMDVHEYVGSATSALRTQLSASQKRCEELMLALGHIESETINMQPTIACLAEHVFPPERVKFIDNHVDVIAGLSAHALRGDPHGLGEHHPYVQELELARMRASQP